MSLLSRVLMLRVHVFGRTLGLAMLLAVAIVGTSMVGLAGAVTTGLIYACVNNSSGTIKIVTAETTCKSHETMLSLTQA